MNQFKMIINQIIIQIYKHKNINNIFYKIFSNKMFKDLHHFDMKIIIIVIIIKKILILIIELALYLKIGILLIIKIKMVILIMIRNIVEL